MRERLQASMIVHGALVFIVGLLAGFPFAFVILGKGDVRAWHMAHLEGILNGLTLFAVAAIMPQLRLGERGLKVVAWTLIVTAWGNMIASLIGPLFGGRGLEFGGSVANSVMYVLFVIAVATVLIALGLVVRGARPRGADGGAR